MIKGRNGLSVCKMKLHYNALHEVTESGATKKIQQGTLPDALIL